MDQNSENNILLNNSKTAWRPTMLDIDNLPQDAYISFQKGIVNFEIEPK